MKLTLASIAFSVSFSFSTAFAQDRFYSWSDQFDKGDPGDIGIESCSDFNTNTITDNRYFFNQQFEIEYSLSDRAVVSVSQAFGKLYPDGSFSFGQFGLEGLYEIISPGRFIVDPVICVEYSRIWSLSSPSYLETKLILTRDFGPLNAIANFSAEYQFGTVSELEPEFSGGISYEFTDWLRGGFEMSVTGKDADPLPDADLHGTGVGPTLSFCTGLFRIASGISYGIDRGSNRLNFRTIVGMDL